MVPTYHGCRALEVVEQIDHRRGLGTEHDLPDDLHVRAPVLLSGFTVAGLDQLEQTLL